MTNVNIVGASVTRFGKHPDSSVKTLAQRAAADALADARLSPADVDLIVFGNAMSGLITGQEMIRSQSAFNGSALTGIPMLNTENACASGAAAVHIARLGILAGKYSTVLVVGAEKLTHPDRAVTQAALSSGLDMDRQQDLMSRYASDSSGGAFMMDIYAEITRGFMAKSNATVEDLAAVTVKNRASAAKNPNAQYPQPVTLDEVLGSRVISDPIRLLMCSPVADGASALVLVSDDVAQRKSLTGVRIAATAIATSEADVADSSPTTRAAQEAFAEAGVEPSALELVEVHDASAPAELIAYEELGLCREGEGPRLLRDGATGPSGRHPVNVNGGLLGRGHPVGATGCAQLVELYRQMLGQAGETQLDSEPTWALAENHGGYLHPHPAVAAVTILHRN